jgi:hypothetical protein
MTRYRRVIVPGDGDCFYHALAIGLLRAQGLRVRVATMRARVAAYLRARRRVVAAARAARPHAWAQDEEVAAAARIFHVCIKCWEGVNKMWVTFGDEANSVIRLYNPFNTHFDYLLPNRCAICNKKG